jgi:hypothetical protein
MAGEQDEARRIGGVLRSARALAGRSQSDVAAALGYHQTPTGPLRVVESCAAQDVRRPAVKELVADMVARDRRRAVPELHRFAEQLGAVA